jgi:hypothetical protein
MEKIAVHRDVFQNKGYKEIETPNELNGDNYEKITEQHASEFKNNKASSFTPYIEFPQVFRKRIAQSKKGS